MAGYVRPDVLNRPPLTIERYNKMVNDFQKTTTVPQQIQGVPSNSQSYAWQTDVNQWKVYNEYFSKPEPSKKVKKLVKNMKSWSKLV